MDEDRFPSAGKDEVWLSGEVSAMQPVSIAEAMQEAANSQFGAGIAAAHAFHDA
jgi:ribosomal protein L12E/L44/L45/RPP1/RPP2